MYNNNNRRFDMTTKKPFHEYILAQLREIELVSASLKDLSGIITRECAIERKRRDAAARAWNCHTGNRRLALKRVFYANRSEIRVLALFNCRDVLEKRRAVLSDEITRAVCINTLRGILRQLLGSSAPSGAEISRRWACTGDVVTLTRWLRNIDLARNCEFWKTRKGGEKPPKFTVEYFLTFILPGLIGRP